MRSSQDTEVAIPIHRLRSHRQHPRLNDTIDSWLHLSQYCMDFDAEEDDDGTLNDPRIVRLGSSDTRRAFEIVMHQQGRH